MGRGSVAACRYRRWRPARVPLPDVCTVTGESERSAFSGGSSSAGGACSKGGHHGSRAA